jgi:hypothetical protein
MRFVRQHSKAVAASVTVLIAAIIAAIVLLAAVQTSLTSESTRRAQNPVYVGGQPTVQTGLNKSATANNLTFRITNVTDSNEPEARHVWTTYTDKNAPLNPIAGSKYVVINATVANVMNGTSLFRYSDIVLVGNDGRSYFANYALGNASCTASIRAEQLKSGGACDVYIAFSIPNDVVPAKIVDSAANPPLVVNLA